MPVTVEEIFDEELERELAGVDCCGGVGIVMPLLASLARRAQWEAGDERAIVHLRVARRMPRGTELEWPFLRLLAKAGPYGLCIDEVPGRMTVCAFHADEVLAFVTDPRNVKWARQLVQGPWL